MSIPKFKEIFTDVLRALETETVIHSRDLITKVIATLHLTDEEQAKTFPGGKNVARNRVHWSIEYLVQSGAAVRPKRGYVTITDLGRALLAESAGKITLSQLKQTEGYQAWVQRIQENAARKHGATDPKRDGYVSAEPQEESTPEEQIQAAITELEEIVANDLLQRIKEESPVFLERAVLKLLHQMGYGSSEDDLEHIGGVGDGGVDGVINQDSLGLDQIYLQAKRYKDGGVGRQDIQAFVGALAGKHASRGIFITTSKFSKEAREYAENLKDTRVILIDGLELGRLMIRYKVGVNVTRSFDVPEVDENFFEIS
jgi:restriction system protein